jgi:hypothetical protein
MTNKYADLVKKSSEVAFTRSLISIHGSSGEGKTTLGATASKFCPPLPNKGPRIHLPDLFWVEFDTGGTDALHDVGVDVDMVRWSDVRAAVQQDPVDGEGIPTELKAYRRAIGVLMSIIEERKPAATIFDTMSQQQRNLAAEVWERPKLWGGNTQRGYGLIGTENQLIHDRIVQLPTQPILLWHAKADLSDLNADKDAQKRSAREELAGGAMGKLDVVLDAVGQARDMYTANSSFIFELKKTVSATDSKKVVRQLISEVRNGVVAKSRGQNTIPPVVEANLLKVIEAMRGTK